MQIKNRIFLSLYVVWIYAIVLVAQVPVALLEGYSDIQVERNVMIPALDGIGLATDIYRKVGLSSDTIGSAPAPVLSPLLLQRTPYGKTSARYVPTIGHLVSLGYVVAIQDIRGRYDSEGIFTKYSPSEGADGAATIAYLSQLPYVNGSIGMWGTSYSAHTAADATKEEVEGIGALILNMGGMANAWDHAVRRGGAFELGRELTWAFRQIPAEIEDSVVDAHFEKERIEDWYQAWPFRRGLNPLSIAPNFEDYILQELTHSDYDDYWRQRGINWEEYYGHTADVPMVHIGGWYDIFLRGTIQNYLQLDSLQSTPKWLIIGPWTHSGNGRSYAGDVDFGEAAAIPDFQVQYQGMWFDYMMRGIYNERLPRDPIQVFIMGTGDGSKNEEGRLRHGGYWQSLEVWPPTLSVVTPYFFHHDGSLSTQKPQDNLSSTTYTYDPKHPVPTIGGSVSARVKDGAYHQRERPDFVGSQAPYLPIKSRQDVVVFQTPLLEEDVYVVGPIKVTLYCSSTAVDTDFTVELVDVYPPSEDFPEGFEMNITDDIVRMSYRNGRHQRSLITPGEVYEVTLSPFATANVFKKGHRIRVDISSSNFPRWDVNPNTGESMGQHRRSIPADNTIYHSVMQPSHIELPIYSGRP